jgi:hypothetical protein
MYTLMMTQTQVRSAILAVVLVAHGGFLTAQAPAAGARVTSTDGRAEVTDPSGDVQPIVYLKSVGSGPQTEVKFPGFDVVKLVVSSDGKAITFAATLTAPPARAANEVIEFHVDTDNNPKTGVTYPGTKPIVGVEYYGALEACIEHPSFGTTCASTEDRQANFTAVVTLEKYGKEWMFKDRLFDIPAAGTVKEPRKTPVKGPVVEASVDYASMGVKSGQTIRLVAREFSAGKIKEVEQGFLPEILLTLK